jgi:CRISPR-associated protein Cmr3
LHQTQQEVFGPPQELTASEGSRLRVVLLTPAIFHNGSAPDKILGARVVASAVGRPEVSSGWDYKRKRPKSSRRMASARSVYWVDLGDVPKRDWIERAWMQNISDDEQERRDGFGLAVVGVA